MWTKFMSAWLCAPAGVADEVWVVDGAADEVAFLVAELLHAPMTATAANVATPAATVLVLFTKSLSSVPKSVHHSALPAAIGLS